MRRRTTGCAALADEREARGAGSPRRGRAGRSATTRTPHPRSAGPGRRGPSQRTRWVARSRKPCSRARGRCDRRPHLRAELGGESARPRPSGDGKSSSRRGSGGRDAQYARASGPRASRAGTAGRLRGPARTREPLRRPRWRPRAARPRTRHARGVATGHGRQASTGAGRPPDRVATAEGRREPAASEDLVLHAATGAGRPAAGRPRSPPRRGAA